MEMIVVSPEQLQKLIADAVRDALGVRSDIALAYTVADAARLLKCSKKSIYNWAASGDLQVALIGHRRYISGESIRRRLAAN